MKLKEQLIKGAVRAYGCAEGLAQLDGALDKGEIMQCFIDRIDFCLARNFPDKEYLKRHFRAELPEKGIYVDEEVALHNAFAVLLGECRGRMVADGYAVCRLYVKHTSRLEIEAGGNAFVMADVLDDAQVHISCRDKARVVVNLYARAQAVAGEEGQVKIIHKHKETYDL